MQPTENGALTSKLAFAQTSLKENVKRYREADQSLGSNGRAASKLGSNRPNSRLHFKEVLNSCSAFAKAFLKKRNEQPHSVTFQGLIREKTEKILIDAWPSINIMPTYLQKNLSLENTDIKKTKAQKQREFQQTQL